VSRGAWGRLLGALLVVAAAGFLVRAIATNWSALQAHDWQVRPVLLALSLALHIGVLAWGVVVWMMVQRRFAPDAAPLGELMRIWFLSNLARYIPGKIFQFVAVAHLGRGAAAGASVLLASLLVHTGFSLLAAAVVGGWTLGPAAVPAVPAGLWIVGATALAAIAVHPLILDRGLALVSRVTRRDLLRWHGGWADSLVLLGFSVAAWMLYGFAYFLFLASLTPLNLSALPALAGVNALSFVAGYLAIVTPGGLGVREAAMTGLLLPVVPASVAAVLSIASRLWTIAAELIGGGIVLAVFRSRPAGTADQTLESAER
jgi:glycosyltransferase 2 family protein